jgi:pimeloyl-[acyl-carrier protein] methyl ester esterase
MSSVSAIVTLSGWADDASSLSSVFDMAADPERLHSCSVYELLEDIWQEQPLSTPAIPSPYAARLSAYLSPTQETAIIAHSMGGIVALEAAIHFPSRVHSLVLINATSCFVRRKTEGEAEIPGVAKSALRAMKFGLSRAPRLTMEQFYLRACSDPVLCERKTRASLSLESGKLLHGLSYLEQANFSDLLSQVRQRVLVIHAEEDRVIPSAASRYLAERLPNATLVFVPGAGHCLPEEAPELIETTISTFLRE